MARVTRPATAKMMRMFRSDWGALSLRGKSSHASASSFSCKLGVLGVFENRGRGDDDIPYNDEEKPDGVKVIWAWETVNVFSSTSRILFEVDQIALALSRVLPGRGSRRWGMLIENSCSLHSHHHTSFSGHVDPSMTWSNDMHSMLIYKPRVFCSSNAPCS